MTARAAVLVGVMALALASPGHAQDHVPATPSIESADPTWLPRFRARLAEARRRLVRLSFYGTSHTASDQYTSVLRAALQRRFGDGGAGAFLPMRPLTFADRRDVVFESASGFVGRSTRRTRGVLDLGATGLALEARGEAHARLRVMHPVGGVVRLWATALRESARVSMRVGWRHDERTLRAGESVMIELPAEAASLEVTVSRARILALSVESTRGVVVESFGVPGARAVDAARWEARSFEGQLADRPPDVVFLELGTNEIVGRGTVPEHRAALGALIARFRQSAPVAMCVVIGPSNLPRMRGGEWTANERGLALRDAFRLEALAAGCGFFDLIAFEGGLGDLDDWVARGLVLADHVHLSDAGHARLAAALERALLER